MPGWKIPRIVALSLALAATASAVEVSGTSALEFTRRAVEFGPRPPGSPANLALQNYILAQLRKDGCEPADAKKPGCEIVEDAFMAKTPKGMVAMKNIIAKFPGKSGRAVALTGHFDTKLFPGRNFVGASDGGSSTGFLLELSRVLAHQPRADDVYLVFFDGEEAIREEWIDPDNLYGSRHLADKWRQDGTLTRLKALINIDMIGDKNLDIKQETQGNAALRKLVWNAAAELGYGAYFQNDQQAEEDDHMPFVKLGVPAIDIIDIDYPPWHKDTDTMDKLSARSFDIVGTVIVEAIHRLER